MKRVGVVNSLSGAAQTLVNTILLLLVVPVFVKTLGLTTYGVYALVSTIGNFGLLTNFGFNASLIKYVAEQKDRSESNYDIVATFIVMGGATLALGILGIVFAGPVLHGILNIASEADSASARVFYMSSVASSIFLVTMQVPSAVLDAMQKVYVTNGVQMAMGIGKQGLILVSLILHPSLMVIGLITLAVSIAGSVLMGYLALRVWGPVSCPGLWKRFSPVALKHLRYGRGIYASALMFFLYEPATKILISQFVGLVEVGYFDVALRIKSIVWSVMERLIYPVLPHLARMTRPAEIRRLIEDVQGKLVLLVVPILFGVVFLAQPVISLWLGTAVVPLTISVVLVVGSYLPSLVFVPLYQFLMMKGHPEKTFIIQSLNLAVNLLGFIALVPPFGYFGALAAYCLALFVSPLLCLWYQHTLLGGTGLGSPGLALKGLKLALGAACVNIIGISVASTDEARIAVLLVLNVTTTALFVRWLHVVSTDDVERYIGRGNRLGKLVEQLLVRAKRP